MIKKVIVFGLGGVYKKYKPQIEKEYNIIGYSDNNISNKSIVKEKIFILPKEIKRYEFDNIIVCSSYIQEIINQLVGEIGINQKKILVCEEIFDKGLTKEAFRETIALYNKMNTRKEFEINEYKLYPILNEANKCAGEISIEYFLQDIWAAKKIFINNPKKHYDVGSRLEGFISHLLTFREEVTLIDIRALPYTIKGINFIQSDATEMKEVENDSLDSLSSLHALEHFGLGRYGDCINPEACFKAMKAFQRVIKKGGKLYLSVPIAVKDTVYFNAHREFNPLTIVKEFDRLILREFAYINEKKELNILNGADLLKKINHNLNSVGKDTCGMFEFEKIY